MTILFFSRRFWPHVGGVEKHVLEVARELIKRGSRVTVVCEEEPHFALRPGSGLRRGKGEKLDKIDVYRIPVSVGSKLKKFQIWWWLLKNRKLIIQSDIIHCHDVFFWYLPFRFLFPKKPVYVTFHGWEGKFPVPKRYILARKIWEKLCWGNICVGDYLKKWYGTRSNFITYGATELTKFKTKKKLVNKISYIGRIDEDVGIKTYLQALKILIKRGVVKNVEFYGDGNFRKEAEKIGKVKGFITDVWEQANNSAVVLSSSYLSLIESLFNFKLSLAVYENDLKKDYLELSPLNDFIIIANSSSEIVSKIIYFLNHPEEERKLVERGYRWAREQTWEKVADLYLKLWG